MKKGFTLIELLVVIAIIGILSSVVLVSLNSARQKGTDAKIQAQLSGVRAAMEIYYSNNSGYGTTTTSSCSSGVFTDPKVKVYLESNDIMSDNICFANSTGYAIATRLVSAPTNGFCVDSNGNSLTAAWSTMDASAKLGDSTGCK